MTALVIGFAFGLFAFGVASIVSAIDRLTLATRTSTTALASIDLKLGDMVELSRRKTYTPEPERGMSEAEYRDMVKR